MERQIELVQNNETSLDKLLNKVKQSFETQTLDESCAGKFDVYILPDKQFIDQNCEKNTSIENELSKVEVIDSLYIHFGYCPSLCKVCPYPKMDDKEKAEDLLIKELTYNVELVKGKKLKSLLFGGGTPNDMSMATFAILIQEVKKCDLEEFEQVGIEIHPGLDYQKYIELLAENFGPEKVHVSIGLQSTNDEKIPQWRESKNDNPFLYTNEQVENIIRDLNTQGISQINVDLLLATFKDWEAEKNGIAKLIAQGVPKFTLYPIYGKYMHRQVIQKWSAEELIKIRKEALEFFKKNGFYHAINPNYFVKNGDVANQESIVQFDGGTLVAVGLGARGKIQSVKKDVIYENHRSLNEYEQSINNGLLPANKIYGQNENLALSNEVRRLVFPEHKISKESFESLVELAGNNKEKILQIFKDYFSEESGGYDLTDEGRLILDIIQGSLWEYIKNNFKNKDTE
jgi:oxygen-independent coproporphyrinogen III oxidase